MDAGAWAFLIQAELATAASIYPTCQQAENNDEPSMWFLEGAQLASW